VALDHLHVDAGEGGDEHGHREGCHAGADAADATALLLRVRAGGGASGGTI
jgi:hypothetical protein